MLANLQDPPPPVDLLNYVKDLPLLPPHGLNYSYSNSDNIIVGLMVAAASGESYEDALTSEVLNPLGLTHTTLPSGSTLPLPYVHGYGLVPDGQPEDVSSLFAAGWTWASGGVVATPADRVEVHPGVRIGAALRQEHAGCPIPVRSGQLRASRAGQQRSRAGAVPILDSVRHGVRTYREHGRIYAVCGSQSGRLTVGDRIRQRPDHPDGQLGALRSAP